MSLLEAIVLGFLQGLTEFLPVSSSGHLVIMQSIFNINDGGITFEIFVHFGTLLAVFIVFREEIWSLIRNPFQKLTFLIIVGSIPTAIIGFTFKPIFEQLFNSVLAVGISLMITGFILLLADRHKGGIKTERNTTWSDAIIIGVAQGLAITPGISRAGFTISAGLLLGLNREMAARYSFLLSIPVILGANLLELKDVLSIGINEALLIPYIAGTVVAALSGIVAIKILLNILKQGKLRYFSYYVWFIGSIIIIQQLVF